MNPLLIPMWRASTAYSERMTSVNPLVAPLRSSWVRTLRAGGKSPRTIESYLEGVDSFTRWCEESGRPVMPTEQRRADVEEFIGWLITMRSSGTAGVRYRSLRQWFRWLDVEDEADDVMAGMSHPTLNESPPPIIRDEHLRALLDITRPKRRKPGELANSARGLADRRDHAILRVLIDTGMRRGELAALTLTDVDLELGVITIRKAKTKRGRLVPLGAKAADAVDRYLRARPQHRHAARPELWLGLHGPLTGEGVRQIIKARCVQAGIPHVHVHQFRHTAAHRWLLAGGQEQDLARIAGWTPGSAMLGRYGASAAEERAREAHRRIAPGDSL